MVIMYKKTNQQNQSKATPVEVSNCTEDTDGRILSRRSCAGWNQAINLKVSSDLQCITNTVIQKGLQYTHHGKVITKLFTFSEYFQIIIVLELI